MEMDGAYTNITHEHEKISSDRGQECPSMSQYLGAVEGLKILPGCLLARQGQTKSSSGLWGLGLKVECGVWHWGRWLPPARFAWACSCVPGANCCRV